ncbi:MAG: ArnT family glycosyltransferase [Paracoccaceae bacterium]
MFLSNSSIKLIILLCFFIKIILASYLPLLNDEAYTISVTNQFSISFFDHPPIGFWSSLIFSKLIGESLLFYRLPFIIYGFATTFILYKIGKEVGNSLVGLWTALLYNLAPFYFFSGSLFVVPDAPLNLGIVLVGFCLIKLHKNKENYENLLLLILGFSLALTFASKYQGFLVGLGCLVVLSFSKKKILFFKNPFFYFCVFISLIGVLPTIIWNYKNEWISFKFHESRQGYTLNLSNFLIMLFASFIYLLPQTILIPASKFLVIIKNQEYKFNNLSPEKILTLLALPNIIIFILVYITSNKTFPHWIMPGWLLLLPIIAKILLISYSKIKIITFYCSTIFVWSLLVIVIFHSQTGILTNYQKRVPNWDNTLELINWRMVKEPVENIIGVLEDNNIKLAAFTWTEAGQFSTVMGNKYEIVVIEGDPHHFQFMKLTNQPKQTILVKMSLGIKPDIISILNRLKVYDNNAKHIENIVIKRGNKNYATASLFLLKQ